MQKSSPTNRRTSTNPTKKNNEQTKLTRKAPPTDISANQEQTPPQGNSSEKLEFRKVQPMQKTPWIKPKHTKPNMHIEISH